MIEFSKFFTSLRDVRPELSDALSLRTRQVIESIKHGDVDRWLCAINNLPAIIPSSVDMNTAAVRIGDASDGDSQMLQTLEKSLMEFHPWRKGPFEVFGVNIDTEWRCDLKWARLEDAIKPLQGRTVLDVGSGNGYYCMRMIGAGARAVVGIDPLMLYVLQYQALNKYLKCDDAAVLPLRYEDLPEGTEAFDTVFSMGVLYHRRDPVEHLKNLRNQLSANGELVLETLVIDTVEEELFVPQGRYGKMRNVWNIPSPAMLKKWLLACGYANVRIVDVTPTTTAEQRATSWMTFESLNDYLDPENASKTIEGHPGPIRAVVLAEKS